MSNYYNSQCGGIGDWKVLEGTYLATPTGTPFTLYLDTNTGTYTGYSSTGAAFPLGAAGGAGLTSAQVAQLNQATADNTTQTGQIVSLNASQTAQDTLISNKLTSNTAIIGGTKTKVTYDTKGLVTSGTDATASDMLNVPAGSITDTNVQSAINTIASRLAVEELKSTSTKKGNLPTGGAKASPVVINPASMPLSLLDGDYYTVNTVNSATANYYDLTAIGYGIVNAGIGAKISFNATQNEYIFQNAGENQIASEVPTTPSIASSIAIATVSTNQENLNTEFKTAIKTAQENLGVFVPSKQYLAGNVIVENNKIYKANTGFTATATFLVTDWTEVSAPLPKSSYNLSYGYSTGNNTTGDQDLTEEIFTINSTITNAVLVVKSGTFPATATTLRIKAGATDYVTIIVPANQGVTTGTSLPCTIVTPLVAATSTAPIQTILATSQPTPAVSFKIITTNQN